MPMLTRRIGPRWRATRALGQRRCQGAMQLLRNFPLIVKIVRIVRYRPGDAAGLRSWF